MFKGSYLESDVNFLLKVIDIDFVEREAKEKLIKDKKIHYSEMISREYIPSQNYLDTFYTALQLNKTKVARDVLKLANYLKDKNKLTLVSLARAGTPIGVLLKRTLKEVFDMEAPHYSISIIRDRGIDENAINYIRENEEGEFIFIDGWTGKGVINRELKKFIKEYNKKYSTDISDKLYVLADIAGKADFASTNQDYLIPSAILNSTVTGLISRSILNDEYVKKDDFHACKYYEEFRDSDLTLFYIDEVMSVIKNIKIDDYSLVNENKDLANRVDNFLEEIKKEFNIENINHIKPSIGETTRVLLRRTPYKILVNDLNSEDVKHLKLLSDEKNIDIEERKDLPYIAVGIIK